MDVLVPFLAACTALQSATIIAASRTAIATNINRVVEVTIHTFDGGVSLSDLFAGRNVFESHPEDFRLIVERTSGADSKMETLGVERVRNAIAVVA